MNLEVGMYVRTKNRGTIPSYISKINEIGKNVMWTDLCSSISINIKEEEYKVSSNIIDLIEVGDFMTYKSGNCYTNYPCRVYGTSNEDGVTTLMIDGNRLKDIIITSVVTKEQFSSMEYKVKE